MPDLSSQSAVGPLKHRRVLIILFCLILVVKIWMEEVTKTSDIMSRVKESNRMKSSAVSSSSSRTLGTEEVPTTPAISSPIKEGNRVETSSPTLSSAAPATPPASSSSEDEDEDEDEDKSEEGPTAPGISSPIEEADQVEPSSLSVSSAAPVTPASSEDEDEDQDETEVGPTTSEISSPIEEANRADPSSPSVSSAAPASSEDEDEDEDEDEEETEKLPTTSGNSSGIEEPNRLESSSSPPSSSPSSLPSASPSPLPSSSHEAGTHVVNTTSGNSSQIEEANPLESSSSSPSVSSEAPASSSHNTTTCPPPDPAVEARFPNYPQRHNLGKFTNQTGAPFLTQDFWYNVVDNRRTFFLRTDSKPNPVSAQQLKEWIQSRPHPISLVINNQKDRSFPPYHSDDRDFELYINETNLHAIYAGNAQYLPEYADKIHAIPLGLKFALSSSQMFGEPKDVHTERFQRYCGSSPEETKERFSWTNRTSTVYKRAMDPRSNKGTTNYRRDTPALSTNRGDVPGIVSQSAPNTVYLAPKGKTPVEVFLQEVRKHRFVISPPGNGLDTHATWEALLCGCIPIIPRSDLDRVFDDLPVWLVDNWDEITDESVKEKEAYFLDKTYKWEKLFQPYWKEKIYEGLCTVTEEVSTTSGNSSGIEEVDRLESSSSAPSTSPASQEVSTTLVSSSQIEEASPLESSSSSPVSSASSHNTTTCPPPDPAVEARFRNYPQRHNLGKFTNQTGAPYLTQDFWYSVVDNRRTFFLRTDSKPNPVSAQQLKEWIQSRPHPISLVINNQKDRSFPPYHSDDRDFELYINETNLHAIYAGNAQYLPEYADKIHAIPLGLKFALGSSQMFGEGKDVHTERFQRYCGSSPEHSKEMFSWTNRTSTVYKRAMDPRSNKGTTNYRRDTPALSTNRGDVPGIVSKSAPNTVYLAPKGKTPMEVFLEQIKIHRFVISPPGNGLDTHATWEALLCGCIPIIPRSDLDRVFDDLPVWFVDNWDEITDESVKEKEAYFLGKTYNWEKLFQPYWKEKIYEGLCTV